MKLVPGDLIEAAKYGSNMGDFEFTLTTCAFVLALFPAFMVEPQPRRVDCFSLKALGRPPIAHYLKAARERGWVKERRGCDRMCPKSWTIELTDPGTWVVAAFRDRQGYAAAEALKAGDWFAHLLKSKAREAVKLSLELAADMPPAECIGNREWRLRVEAEAEGEP